MALDRVDGYAELLRYHRRSIARSAKRVDFNSSVIVHTKHLIQLTDKKAAFVQGLSENISCLSFLLFIENTSYKQSTEKAKIKALR